MTDGEQTFDGMERTTKFSFTGMGYESMKVDFERGQEVEFKVRGKVKMIGDEEERPGAPGEGRGRQRGAGVVCGAGGSGGEGPR